MDLALLSLVVALLTVLLSPLVTLAVAKRSHANALRVTRANVRASVRQSWLENTRDTLAELLSTMHHCYVAIDDESPDQVEVLRKIGFLQEKIALLLDPKDAAHTELLAAISDAVRSLDSGRPEHSVVVPALQKAADLSRTIVRAELERIENDV